MRRDRRAMEQRCVAAWIASHAWGSIIFLLLITNLHFVRGGSSTTSAYDEDSSLARCLKNLAAADTDNNQELSSYEFVIFVDLESGGELNATGLLDTPINLVLIYYFFACLCAQNGGASDCCVGGNAAIDLVETDGRPVYTTSLCSLVDLGIYDALNPTPRPTPISTLNPSTAPVQPSMQPVPPFTASPTLSPFTIAPTGLPSFVTVSPSQQPTLAPVSPAPSFTPTLATPPPTPQVTAPPSAEQTAPPTVAPIQATSPPSLAPATVAPSQATSPPSLAPATVAPSRATIPPSLAPLSVAPTKMPVSAPTIAPFTPQPTLQGATCVSFQYGLNNQAGLDAFAILNMVNNSLRTGLIIATRNVTIEILNATFPRTTQVRASVQSNSSDALFQKFLLMISPWDSGSLHSIRHGNNANRRALSDRTNRVRVAMERALIDLYPNVNAEGLLRTQVNGMFQRRAVLEIPNDVQDQKYGSRDLFRSRRLVYYSDTIPITIDYILDNPICNKTTVPPTFCAVISSTVCVILEDGETASVIDGQLLEGFQQAVNTGALQEAIPPEYQV